LRWLWVLLQAPITLLCIIHFYAHPPTAAAAASDKTENEGLRPDGSGKLGAPGGAVIAPPSPTATQAAGSSGGGGKEEETQANLSLLQQLLSLESVTNTVSTNDSSAVQFAIFLHGL
jgi:hypothetical protein